MTAQFQLVDVFGSGRFTGNPVAVVGDAQGIDDEEMMAITRWLNLSETTFLLPPDDPAADYKVRIFTLERELPFAGHPTLGTCHAWLKGGGVPRDPARIVQQCGLGLVPIRHSDDGFAFAAPPMLRSGPIAEDKVDEIAEVLRIDPARILAAEWVDNGPGWAGILLSSADEVLAVEPHRSHSSRIEIGIVGPHEEGSPVGWEVRAIFSGAHGELIEDPVTGSLNASLAQWLLGTGRARAPYLAAQGTALGRRGRVRVTQDDDGTIWIGGRCETLFTGSRGF